MAEEEAELDELEQRFGRRGLFLNEDGSRGGRLRLITPDLLEAYRSRSAFARKVNLIIAGAQKAGTTALYQYLRRHEEICTPIGEKELHYFSEQRFFEDEPDYELYDAWFDPQPEHKVLLEATPEYMVMPECMPRIRDYNPDMKILMILRNPIQRAYSAWQMEHRRDGDRQTFTEALKRGTESSYVKRGFYAEQIERVWECFSPEQTMVLRNEDLLRDRDEVLARVYEFAGVSPRQNRDVKAEQNTYEPMSDEDRAYLVEVFEPEIRKLEALLGWDCSSWLKPKST